MCAEAWPIFCPSLTFLGDRTVVTWQIRVREDDEIVDALNRYTSKLQQSLKIINSTDM